MKTIEEHNKEAVKSKVHIHHFSYTLEWVPSGIMCPCGCEKELLKERWPISNRADRQHVRCPKTKRNGTMTYSDPMRLVIKGIEWYNEA